ncbi:MAG TPA: hypothetical protein VM911_08595 [Pyrinomonadaceae bacterium]|jgi:hypothetical protein|nr:hypothetical protein [Pyrinomonadaceae bacterium]
MSLKRKCFLCGLDRPLTVTDEDVVPNWIQRRFEINSERFVIANLTTIKNQQIKIPACSECNNIYLGRIESRIASSSALGLDSFKTVRQNTLFVWLAKIFYGLVYKQAMLTDHTRPHSRTTVFTGAHVNNLQHIHNFLQVARERAIFKNFFPASIFLFKTLYADDPKFQFHMVYCLETRLITIIMKDIGIVATLDDCGIMKQLSDSRHKKLSEATLHPYQVMEFAGRTSYAIKHYKPEILFTSKLIGFRKYISAYQLVGTSRAAKRKTWSPLDCAYVVSRFTRTPLQDWYRDDGSTFTTLLDEKGDAIQFRSYDDMKYERLDMRVHRVDVEKSLDSYTAAKLIESSGSD